MNIQLGLLLMLVGMVTVFCILLIVIYGSRLLINLVNRIAKDEPAPTNTKSILEAAVSQITGGKGRIVKITEL